MNNIRKLINQVEDSTGEKKTELRLELAFAARVKAPKLSTEQAMIAFNEAKESGNTKHELRAIFLICTSALYNEEFTESEKWIETLAKRGMELNHNPSVGRSYVLKSRWSARKGKKLDAAEFLLKALEFFDADKNVSDIASCFNGIGNVYNDLNDLDNALIYFKKTMPFARKLSKNAHNMVKQNIALILTRKKEYAPAWKIYDHILDNLSDDDIETKRVVLLNLAHICQKTNEPKQSLNYVEEAIELSKKSYPSHFLIRPLCNKALLLIEFKDFNEAKNIFLEAEKIALSADNLSDILEVYYGFSELYEKWDAPLEQVKYLKKIIELEKNINQTKSTDSISLFEHSYHLNQYKDRNALLQMRNQLISDNANKLNEKLNLFIEKNYVLQNNIKDILTNIDLSANNSNSNFSAILLHNIASSWKQPLNLLNSLIQNLAELSSKDELDQDLLNININILKDIIVSMETFLENINLNK